MIDTTPAPILLHAAFRERQFDGAFHTEVKLTEQLCDGRRLLVRACGSQRPDGTWAHDTPRLEFPDLFGILKRLPEPSDALFPHGERALSPNEEAAILGHIFHALARGPKDWPGRAPRQTLVPRPRGRPWLAPLPERLAIAEERYAAARDTLWAAHGQPSYPEARRAYLAAHQQLRRLQALQAQGET